MPTILWWTQIREINVSLERGHRTTIVGLLEEGKATMLRRRKTSMDLVRSFLFNIVFFICSEYALQLWPISFNTYTATFNWTNISLWTKLLNVCDAYKTLESLPFYFQFYGLCTVVSGPLKNVENGRTWQWLWRGPWSMKIFIFWKLSLECM